MKNKKISIHKNLMYLRSVNHLSLEEVASAIGVSRQAVSKWESGETMPDIINCDALSQLYEVSLDNLLHFDHDQNSFGIPPKGKHMFGTTILGERGQVVIPKAAREMFDLKVGDVLVVLGDENAETRGIALVPGEAFMETAKAILENIYPKAKE